MELKTLEKILGVTSGVNPVVNIFQRNVQFILLFS